MILRTALILATLGACTGQVGEAPVRANVGSIPIINGEPAADDGAVVLIAWTDADGKLLNYCSGSVITTTLVLTAAHCIVENAAGVKVGFGEEFSKPHDNPFIEVVETMVHPSFVAETFAHDLALLKLQSVAPVRPLRVNFNPFQPKIGMDVRMVGFGNRSLDETPPQGDRYQGDGVVVGIQQGDLYIAPNDAAVLAGDSGGPTFAADNDGVVIGVHSRSAKVDGVPVGSIDALTSKNSAFLINGITRLSGLQKELDTESVPEPQPEEEATDRCLGIDYDGVCCEQSSDEQACEGYAGWVVWCEDDELVGEPCNQCAVSNGFAECSESLVRSALCQATDSRQHEGRVAQSLIRNSFLSLGG